MFVLNVGLTYKNTPIALREKTAITQEHLPALNRRLNQEKSVLENVILSTCNRTEIFAVVDQLHTGRYYLKRFLAETFHLEIADLEPYLIFKENRDALQHAFATISGLESMVIGETQILGQMKKSFLVAQAAGTTGTIFNYLFNEMIHFGKAMHTKYRINDRSASLSQAALKVAKNQLTSLADKKIFILGAGEMSELVIKNTQNFEIGEITVFNRTLANAQALASCCKCTFNIEPLEKIYTLLPKADVVITALNVEQPFLLKQQLETALTAVEKEILFIDLGVPRNIDVHSKRLPQVRLQDVDQIFELISRNQEIRFKLVAAINEEIEMAIQDFYIWENQLGIVPIIQQLREKTLQAEEAAMTSLLKKIPDLSEREIKVIRKHMKSIVNQTLRTPIKEIKEMAIQENAAENIAVVQRVFGLTATEGVSAHE